jgi:ureidoglycolate lyase
MEVRSQPLSVEAFSPFGEVVSAGLKAGASANQGTAVRFDWCADLVNLRSGARPNLAVFRSTPVAMPYQPKLLERHPQNSQAFIPMVTADFLIVVAPHAADGKPDLSGLCVFRCKAGQGINYKPGVWHHPIIALDEPSEFAMLAWEDGSAADCEEFFFENGPVINL